MSDYNKILKELTDPTPQQKADEIYENYKLIMPIGWPALPRKNWEENIIKACLLLVIQVKGVAKGKQLKYWLEIEQCFKQKVIYPNKSKK